MHSVSAAVQPSGMNAAAVDGHSFPHPDQPEPVASGGTISAAIIDHVDLQRLRTAVDLDVGPAGLGVLHHISETLLDDPVDRQVKPGRKSADVSLCRHLNGNARLGKLSDELRQAAKPWLRR